MDINETTCEEIESKLHSIHNRSEIARMLIAGKMGYHLLPTLLEDNYEDAAYLAGQYCVVEE